MKKNKWNATQGLLQPLGVSILQDSVNFAVTIPCSRTGQLYSCELVLYNQKTGEETARITMQKEWCFGNIGAVRLENFDSKEFDYNYCIDGKIVQDPYAWQIIGREKWGQEENPNIRCRIPQVGMQAETPLVIPFSESFFYKIHIRGFTMHRSSKVKHKGTFLGVIDKIPYLKELGVKQLEIMPMYEFAERVSVYQRFTPYQDPNLNVNKPESKINYWGFGKGNYFAPKASYAVKNPVTECKEMIHALHQAGIEVIMEMNFDKSCGQSMMIDCIKYWVREYHIDGFRFYGDNVPMTALATDPFLGNTKLIAENIQENEIYPEAQQSFCHVASSNNEFLIHARCFLKGDAGHTGGFAHTSRQAPGKIANVHYVANHDGFTLQDVLTYNRKHNEANKEGNRDGRMYEFSWNCGTEGPSRKKAVKELREKLYRNALVMLFTAQGTPLLVSGDEFGATKKGNNNSYCQDNEINWLDWSLAEKNKKRIELVKKLVQFRLQTNMFHPSESIRADDYKACGYPDVSYHSQLAWSHQFEPESRILGILYCNRYSKDDDNGFFYSAFNMHWEPQTFALPNLPKGLRWRMVVDTSLGDSVEDIFLDGEELLPGQKEVEVSPRSILMLSAHSE